MSTQRPSLQPSRGVLRRVRADGLLVGRRVAPCAALAPFVHHFWAVEWDLRSPFVVDTLPHPVACITLERGRAAKVMGVPTQRTQAVREGAGRIFGITFRPAAFEHLLAAPMTTLTDREVEAEPILGDGTAGFARRMARTADVEEAVSIAEGFLAARVKPLTAPACAIRDVTERIMEAPSLTRTSDVAAALGVDVRSIQRRFRRYVGVGPKWVIRRYRLHEAAAQLSARHPPPLADLAASLGYADQAHFARDFKAVVGHAPGRFAASAK